MGNNVFTEKEIKFLVVSYLTDSLNEDDLQRLKLWIDSSNENRKLFNLFKDTWVLTSDNKDRSREIEDSWQALSEKIHRKRFGLGLVNWSREKVNFTKYLKLAASWLLFFGLGSAISWLVYSDGQKKVAAISTEKRVQVTAPLGAKSFVLLPDSSQIWLNAGSTITYNQYYGLESRSLSLSGEAYFKVSKDSLHPFLVETQDMVIRALGTSFNIKSYPEEKLISTTLEEGLIDVEISGSTGKNERILLKPNESLIYNKSIKKAEKLIAGSGNIEPLRGEIPVKPGGFRVESNVRTELTTSWKDPRWIIEKEPLGNLAPKLERRFNLKILFLDEQIKNYRFTGIIENETAEQIMYALQLTAPLEYNFRKDTIRLKLNLNCRESFRKVMDSEK